MGAPAKTSTTVAPAKTSTTVAPEPAVVYKLSKDYVNICKNIGGINGAIWRPKNYQSEFCSLGDVATKGYKAPSQVAILVSRKKSGALVHPESFSRVGKESEVSVSECAIYTMNAPAGYTCLGGVAMSSHNTKPDKNKFCCVKNKYIVQGAVQFLYGDGEKGTSSMKDVSLWTVIRDDDAYGLDGGNFVPVRGRGDPSLGYLLKEDDVTVKDAWSVAAETKPLKLFEHSVLTEIWNNGGTGVKAVSIWRTKILREGFYSLGDIAVNSHSKPTIGFLLKPSTPQYKDLIRAPTSYTPIWSDGDSGASRHVTIWRGICPGGYIALGNVATDGADPGTWDIACVHNKYVERGTRRNSGNWELIWEGHGSGASEKVSIFEAKETTDTQQTVRGMGAIVRHGGSPSRPYLLKKSEHTYSSEKPISSIEMSNVEFKLEGQKQVPTQPVTLNSITIQNNDNTEQTSEQTIKFTKSESKTFTFEQSIELGVEMTISAGIPLVADAETSYSFISTTTISSGEEKTTTTEESITATVVCPPNSKCTATIMGKRYAADIPYTASIKKIYYDGTESTAKISGTYHGASVSEAHITYSEPEKIE